MKKIVTIAIFGIYLLLQVGIITHVHMCHNSIADIQLFDKSNISCDIHENYECCKTENKQKSCCNAHATCSIKNSQTHESCCTNTTIILQYLNNTQYVSQSPSIQLYPIHIAKQMLITYENTSERVQSNLFIEYSSPPPEDLVSLFCSYIFYG